MKRPHATTLVFLALLAGTLAAGAGARTRPAAAETPPADSGDKGTVEISDKAAKKISMAIGEEVGDFAVTNQEAVDSNAGQKTTEYTVRTNGGKTYKCQIIEASRAGKFFSFGTAGNADALCTQFSGSTGGKGRAAAAPAGKGANAAAAGGKPKASSPIAVSDKDAKKISTAIGVEPSQFVVTAQQPVDSNVGQKATEYTVRTNGGKTYKCQIIEASRLGKIATFGTAGSSDALCTDFTKGSRDQGKTNQAACNALLRAAHKCD